MQYTCSSALAHNQYPLLRHMVCVPLMFIKNWQKCVKAYIFQTAFIKQKICICKNTTYGLLLRILYRQPRFCLRSKNQKTARSSLRAHFMCVAIQLFVFYSLYIYWIASSPSKFNPSTKKAFLVPSIFDGSSQRRSRVKNIEFTSFKKRRNRFSKFNPKNCIRKQWRNTHYGHVLRFLSTQWYRISNNNFIYN